MTDQLVLWEKEKYMIMRCGDLELDRRYGTINFGGREIISGECLFTILWTIMSKEGKTATFEELLYDITQYQAFGEVRTIVVYVRKLKKQTANLDPITLVPGKGYRTSLPVVFLDPKL